MGHTIVEKVLAAHSQVEGLIPGDLIYPTPDLTVIHEKPFEEFVNELQAIGLERLAQPDRMMVIADHEVPCLSLTAAERFRRTKALAEQLQVRYFIPPGRHGIQHQFLVQEGYTVPGSLILIMDIHALNLGAVGSVAIPMVYEFPYVMATGSNWVRTPATLRVTIHGSLQPGVGVRDLAHHIIAEIGPEAADYRVIEFAGPTVAKMSIDSRMVLCGAAVEIGAKSAVIEPDEVTLSYLKGRARFPFEVVRNDPDAVFEREYSCDADRVETMIAVPPSPDNVVPLSAVAGKRVNSAYIGTCASGTIEDLRDAARILRGRKVHPDVTFLVVPSTQATYRQAAEEGLLATLIEGGCLVIGPTCSPCFGAMAPLAAGEMRICTATRNDPGRMGSYDAEIYLASAATVAASAIAGEVVDPAPYLAGP
jgi:3-isopropylmalate/(R)-2-methylmalate dehydratase large subunit